MYDGFGKQAYHYLKESKKWPLFFTVTDMIMNEKNEGHWYGQINRTRVEERRSVVSISQNFYMYKHK